MLQRQCRICNLRLREDAFNTMATMCDDCAVLRDRLNEIHDQWERLSDHFQFDWERQERIRVYGQRAQVGAPLFA